MNFVLILYLLVFMDGNNPNEYIIEKMPASINSAYDEINPVISRDGRTLYFTRVGSPNFVKTLYDLEKDVSKSMTFSDYEQHLTEIYKSMGDRNATGESSTFNQDIWIASGDGIKFTKVVHPEYPLNSALPNSVCSLTPNNNEVVIVNEFYKDGSMYQGFSTIKGNAHNNWQFPKPLFIYDYFSRGTEVNLNMSSDGSIIILSLDRPSSQGDNDLYVSMKVEENLYSSPLPLDKNINTPFRESTPYISRDGQFLFFSSTRPGGYGGNDIYVSRRLDNTWQKWDTPKLLPKPINSAADDSQPFVNEATGFMYFTSRRDGNSDIYRVQYHPVDQKDREKTLHINVVNALTGQPIDAEVAIGTIKDGFYSSSFPTTNASYAYKFIKSQPLMFKARKKGYTGITRNIDLDSLFRDASSVREIDILLDPIDKEANFVLSNIYFEQSTPNIRPESYDALDQLVKLMRSNTNLKMRITGHTDNVGSESSLMWLSKKRAEAIKQYLTDNQVSTSRITTEGKGGSQPLNDNSTEEKKSRNRRVEFTIFKE